jgi:hypothetical protein
MNPLIGGPPAGILFLILNHLGVSWESPREAANFADLLF